MPTFFIIIVYQLFSSITHYRLIQSVYNYIPVQSLQVAASKLDINQFSSTIMSGTLSTQLSMAFDIGPHTGDESTIDDYVGTLQWYQELHQHSSGIVQKVPASDLLTFTNPVFAAFVFWYGLLLAKMLVLLLVIARFSADAHVSGTNDHWFSTSDACILNNVNVNGVPFCAATRRQQQPQSVAALRGATSAGAPQRCREHTAAAVCRHILHAQPSGSAAGLLLVPHHRPGPFVAHRSVRADCAAAAGPVHCVFRAVLCVRFHGRQGDHVFRRRGIDGPTAVGADLMCGSACN